MNFTGKGIYFIFNKKYSLGVSLILSLKLFFMLILCIENKNKKKTLFDCLCLHWLYQLALQTKLIPRV